MWPMLLSLRQTSLTTWHVVCQRPWFTGRGRSKRCWVLRTRYRLRRTPVHWRRLSSGRTVVLTCLVLRRSSTSLEWRESLVCFSWPSHHMLLRFSNCPARSRSVRIQLFCLRFATMNRFEIGFGMRRLVLKMFTFCKLFRVHYSLLLSGVESSYMLNMLCSL